MFIRLLSYERIARVCVCTTSNAARIFVWEAPKIKYHIIELINENSENKIVGLGTEAYGPGKAGG